jgi:hypothetical protein
MEKRMSREVVVYKDSCDKIVVELRQVPLYVQNVHIPVIGSATDPFFFGAILDRDCILKNFATADQAFKWIAYIDKAIKQEEITEDIYNTIFMMCKRRK